MNQHFLSEKHPIRNILASSTQNDKRENSHTYLTGIAIKSNHCSVLHQAASSTAAEPGFPSTVCLPLTIWCLSACPHQKVRHSKGLEKNNQTEAIRTGGGRETNLCFCKEDSTPLKRLSQNDSCPTAMLACLTSSAVKCGGTSHKDHYQKSKHKSETTVN